jgi:hypothetical protein
MKKELVAPLILLLAIVVAALVAPDEATLGSSIRWVYLHVAFTWAGTSLANFAALLGLVMLARPDVRLGEWVYAIELVAVGLYAVGFGLSLVSSWASWGGILWQEPRVFASILVVGAGASAVFVIRSFVKPRMIGLVAIAYAALIGYQLSSTRVVFHPDKAVDATSSSAIVYTFYGMTVLAIAFGVSLILLVGRRKGGGVSPGD